MTIIVLFVLIIIIALVGYLTVWILGMLAPGHPSIIDNIVWVIVVLVIAIMVFNALGLLNGGPTVPRVVR